MRVRDCLSVHGMKANKFFLFFMRLAQAGHMLQTFPLSPRSYCLLLNIFMCVFVRFVCVQQQQQHQKMYVIFSLTFISIE